MKILTSLIVMVLVIAGCAAGRKYAGNENDLKALEQTSINIRAAFARGDIPTILSYHHPDVIKALGYNNYIKGRKELEASLKNSLRNVNLNFKENKVESILIQGKTAVEMTAFTIEAAPKDGGKSSVFKGRAIVVYVRYKMSPTGWASIREIIQPAP